MTLESSDSFAMRWFSCPFCGEGPGHPCRTRSTGVITLTHSGRSFPLRNLIWEARKEQEMFDMDIALKNPEWWAQKLAKYAKRKESGDFR